MSENRGLTRAADRLASVIASGEARTSALELHAHDHPGVVGGVFLCTSATRPASPAPGFLVYESDTGLYSYWDGSAWQTLIDPLYANNVATSKGTTQIVNSSSTSADTDIQFPVASGVMYHFRCMGLFQSTAANCGLGLSFSGPATTYCAWVAEIETALAGTDSWYQARATALTTVLTSQSVAAANIDYVWQVEGLLQPSAAGTLRLRFRPELNGTQVSIEAGSVGILTRID